jgi:hypothetical protein
MKKLLSHNWQADTICVCIGALALVQAVAWREAWPIFALLYVVGGLYWVGMAFWAPARHGLLEFAWWSLCGLAGALAWTVERWRGGEWFPAWTGSLLVLVGLYATIRTYLDER